MATAVYNFVYNIVLSTMLKNAGIVDPSHLHGFDELYVWACCRERASVVTTNIFEMVLVMLVAIFVVQVVYAFVSAIIDYRQKKEMEA